MRSPIRLAPALALVLGVSAAAAEPPGTDSATVVNGEFDTDVSGWTIPGPPFASMNWDPADAFGSLTSGSALTTSVTVPQNNGGVFQCVSQIVPGSIYALRLWMRVASGQPAQAGYAGAFVHFWAGDSCAGGSVGASAYTEYIGTDDPPGSLDLWLQLSAVAVAPQAARSAWVYLNLLRGLGAGGFTAQFDAVSFLGSMFADGFETGDALRWSGGSTH